MADNIVDQDIQGLIASWVQMEMDSALPPGVFDMDWMAEGADPFLFLMAALSEINRLSRKIQGNDDYSFLLKLISRLEAQRRVTAFSLEIQHDIIIEMFDAVRVSLFRSWQIAIKQPLGKGCVYFLLNKTMGQVKIGWTTDLYGRSKVLESQGGVKLFLLGFFCCRISKGRKRNASTI